MSDDSDDCVIVESIPVPESSAANKQPRYLTRSRVGKNTLVQPSSNTRNTRKRAQGKKKKMITEKSDPCFSKDDVDIENYEMSLKVVWKSSNVVRLPIRRFQKMETLYHHFMKLENVPIEKISLMYKNENIKFSDTPESLKLDILAFIEGGIVNRDNTDVTCDPGQLLKEKMGFHVKIQDSSRKEIEIPINVNDKMSLVMIKYAEQVNKPVLFMKFYIDGQIINSDDTPKSLNISSGEVIDVNTTSNA